MTLQACDARVVLRGEWFNLPSIAKRADRSLRTLATRNTATSIFVDAVRAKPELLLKTMTVRRGWRRQGEREFIYAFGHRVSAMTVPSQFDALGLALLVTRAEIRAIHGDCEWGLLMQLLDLAATEVRHLFDAAKPAGTASRFQGKGSVPRRRV
jgi:hypothetical protein